MQKLVDTKIPLQKAIAMGLADKAYGKDGGTGEKPARREPRTGDAPKRKPSTSASDY